MNLEKGLLRMPKSFLFGKGIENIDSNIYDFSTDSNNVIICDELLKFLYSDKFNKSDFIFVKLFNYKVGHVWDYHIDKYIKNPWEGLSDNIPYYEDKDKFWSNWYKFCYHDEWLLWKTMQSVINMYFLLKNKTDNFIIFDFTSNIKKNISNKTDIRYCWDNNRSSKFIWQKIQKIIDKDKFISVKDDEGIRDNINAKTLLLR
jgi:hypothetical protein